MNCLNYTQIKNLYIFILFEVDSSFFIFYGIYTSCWFVQVSTTALIDGKLNPERIASSERNRWNFTNV